MQHYIPPRLAQRLKGRCGLRIGGKRLLKVVGHYRLARRRVGSLPTPIGLGRMDLHQSRRAHPAFGDQCLGAGAIDLRPTAARAAMKSHSISPTSPHADPRVFGDLARRAEEAGRDGFFIWDHIQVSWPDTVGDPTVQLAAIAMATSRIRFGPMVTPLPRRHPWKLAREAATLDQISNGRLVLGIGLGGDWFTELSTFGIRSTMWRAEMLDEGLAIVTGLLTGDTFSFEGKHYTIKPTQFIPKPKIPARSGKLRFKAIVVLRSAWPRAPARSD
jgi:hypothetical protein